MRRLWALGLLVFAVGSTKALAWASPPAKAAAATPRQTPAPRPATAPATTAPRPATAPATTATTATSKAPRWETLPAPAALPVAAASDTITSDGATLWYAVFGKGAPVVLLHGGLGNSGHFADLVRALLDEHQVITLDSRGQGRSSHAPGGLSYRQMAKDVVALLDHLHLERAAVLGWSDGGATALELAIHHRERVSRLYLLGTNYDLSGVKPNRAKTFQDYFARCKREYRQLSPAPDQLGPLLRDLRAMWKSQPALTARELAKIHVPTVVAIGDHDENIRQEHAAELAKLIPGATLNVLPETSHFALWQDPSGVAHSVRAWLDAPAEAAAR